MAAKLKNIYCEQCKGQCWKGINKNAETQKAAMKMFGVIPNNCVNPQIGKPLCPYAEQ